MDSLNNKTNIKKNIINKVKKKAHSLSLSDKDSDYYWEALLIEAQKLSQDKKIKKIIHSPSHSNYY